VSLKLPYRKYPNQYGGFVYSANVPVNIALPQKNAPRSKRIEAIIDSGATFCQFHADLGQAIGIEIEKGDVMESMGIAGPSQMYMHDITLYIPGGPVKIKAGFSRILPTAGLLGMNGFFEHFIVKFDPAALRCELERIFQA
jgi:hypothetical protein